jgi:hypothetical protein
MIFKIFTVVNTIQQMFSISIETIKICTAVKCIIHGEMYAHTLSGITLYTAIHGISSIRVENVSQLTAARISSSSSCTDYVTVSAPVLK